MGAHFGFTTVVFHSLTDRHAYTQTYIGIVCAPWSILCPLIDRVFLDGIYFFVVAQNPKCWLVFFFINPQLIKINVPLHPYQTAAIKNSHQKSNNLKVCIFFSYTTCTHSIAIQFHFLVRWMRENYFVCAPVIVLNRFNEDLWNGSRIYIHF